MAEKKTGGPGYLTNPKSRMMVIGVAVVLVAGLALAVNGMLKKSALEKEQTGPTNTAALPADANKKTVIDPQKVDAQQSELRKTANEDAAKRADSSGQTFIATMRPDGAPASAVIAGGGIDPSMYPARNGENGYARYTGPREPTEQEIRDAEAAQQKKVDEWKRKLTADKTKINEVWEPGSRVFYTAYVGSEHTEADNKEKESQGQPGGAKAETQKKGQVFARAGDIFYGTIDIGMNTDEPSAVTAYILSGPFKGGKLLGALAGQTAPYSEKAVIQFTSLNHPKFERSIPVKIFAVDRDTKRAAVADNVDRHLLTKFGLAAIVDFAQGYAEGKSQNNSTIVYGQNGAPTIVSQTALNNQQLIARGAAKTMNRVASSLAPYTNRPNTLEVYSQTEIGLLVAADIVYVEGVNADNSGPVQGVGANGARRALPQPAVANAYAPALPVQPGQPAIYGQQPVYVPQPAYGQQPVYTPQPAYGGQPALYGQVPEYGQR